MRADEHRVVKFCTVSWFNFDQINLFMSNQNPKIKKMRSIKSNKYVSGAVGARKIEQIGVVFVLLINTSIIIVQMFAWCMRLTISFRLVFVLLVYVCVCVLT